MERIKSLLTKALPFALLIGLSFGAYSAVSSFFQYVATVQKEIAAALLAASATIIVSIATVFIGRYYERKRELDALYRDKKTMIYDEFLGRFFDTFHGNDDDLKERDDLVPFLREFMRKLLLWGGPEVVASFIKWKKSLLNVNAETIFATEDFLLAVRKDLCHSNKQIEKGFFARLFLQEGELLLEMAKINPKVTLIEVDEMSKAIQNALQDTK